MLGHLRAIELADGRRIEYILDAENRLIGKTINCTLVRGWLYDGQLNPVAELDADGNVVSRFVYASRGNVPDLVIREGRTYRIISDLRGSPCLVIDCETGEIVQRMDYDEFGVVTLDAGTPVQPFSFAVGLCYRQTALVLFGYL